MRKSIFICATKFPCLGCTEKVFPNEHQNGCKPTCEKYALARAKADADIKKKCEASQIKNMEFDRIHIAGELWRRNKVK